MHDCTYRHTILNGMTGIGLKMLDIPSAKHRNMQTTPVLHMC